MNLLKIKSLCDKRKGGLRGLASVVGMTEQNLHRCIRENKIQAQDLEKIAKELAVNIGYFFDEEIEIKTAGRDFVERGKIEHSGVEFNAPVEFDSGLAAENAELKRRLIDAQEKIIKLMEDRK